MVLEYICVYLCYFVLFVMVLVSVAFITLVEQKVLGGSQIRLGPNYVGYWGLFQPFADAVKLFNKENVNLLVSNLLVYYLSPFVGLGLMLVLWLMMPFFEGGYIFIYGLLFFICISGLSVYPILMMGWSSNCKYSIMGSMRSVAQMISYEVSLAMVLLSIIWLSGSFSVYEVLSEQVGLWNLFVFFPLGMIWFVSSLAETNRTPYDFSEGESELVSGFNTEYSGGGFVLIFISEYGNILFMGLLFIVIFMGGLFNVLIIFKSLMIVFLFIWVRATMPRYRYDKLMNLAWKSYLPITLMYFLFYLNLGGY